MKACLARRLEYFCFEQALKHESKEDRLMYMKQLGLGMDDLGDIYLFPDEIEVWDNEVVPLLKKHARFEEK